MIEHKDLNGLPLSVGKFVVFARSDAILRYGKITSLTPKGVKVRTASFINPIWRPWGQDLILYSERLLLIPLPIIPIEAFKILEEKT